MMLTDAEIACGAATQDAEWHGKPSPVEPMTVGHCGYDNSTAESPRDLAEAGALLTTNPSKRRGGFCR